MGEAKIRAVLTPDISVLIPSRGRPEMLERCLESLGAHRNVEIIVGLDEDDPRLEDYDFPAANAVHVCIASRFDTLGQCINNLAGRSSGKLLFCLGDDYVLTHPEWPSQVMAGASKLPRGFGVVYPRCAHHPNFPSLPIISRRAYQALGYYMPPQFPHWFLDTWWDEIGIMMGAIAPLELDAILLDGKGKTHGLVDLEFWLGFFEATRPMRAKDAMEMSRLAYDEGTPFFAKLMKEFPQRLQLCQDRVDHLHDPALLAQWERRSEDQPSAHYAQVKAEAETLAGQIEASKPRRPRVAVAVPSGRSWEAGTSTDVAALCTFSAMSGIEIMILNVQTSMVSASRNQTVEIALTEKCDYVMFIDSDMRFPPETLIRLMGHGKDVVGCLYNKRVPPYETLGRLAGPKPSADALAKGLNGLHEALLLPGGVVLVKTDVYRKIGWPAYAETYRWNGGDGVDAFKAMMRDYFWKRPDDEILDSLDGTKFADWITDNYRTGEQGELFPVFSEDFFFCRKARRHGFTLWADIDLSLRVKHLGVLEVTCEQPAPVLAEAAE